MSDRPEPGSKVPWTSAWAAAVAAVAILGLVVGFFLPANREAGPAARRAQCQNNLKNIALAIGQYEQVFKALPPARTFDADGRPLHSWRTLILPFLDQEDLYRSIDLTKPWDDPANAEARATPLSIYRCPDAGPPGTTCYFASTGPDRAMAPDRPRPLAEIADPPGEVLLLFEAEAGHAVPWMAPVDGEASEFLHPAPNSRPPHGGGSNAAFLDGSVRFLDADTPAEVRRAFATIADGEPVDAAR